MDLTEIAEGIEAWVKATLGADLKKTYPLVVASKGKLPDAMIDVQNSALQYGGDVRFPFAQLQQRQLRVCDIQISFMVNMDDEGLGTKKLREFAAKLEYALLHEPTLGDRVQMASQSVFNFDFALPFIQYADGTRGRQMNMNMAVAELVDEGEG